MRRPMTANNDIFGCTATKKPCGGLRLAFPGIVRSQNIHDFYDCVKGVGMAERKGSRRIETTDLQGEGSYVIVRTLTYGQRRMARGMFLRANGGQLPTKKEDLDIKVDARYLEDNDAFTAKLLAENVLECNWVDDKGGPLPLPKDDPEVIDGMTDEEVGFLVRMINPTPTADDEKN
jgi:hypothetical protein